VIGSAYYGAGALANVLEAEDEFSHGDDVDGGFDVAEALANVANASKPIVEELVAEAAAEQVGAAGAGFVAAQLMYDAIKNADETQAYQGASAKFLPQGFGLNPALAQALSAPSDQSNGATASIVLREYARAYHMSARQLLQKLNREPIDNVMQFIDETANMPTQASGRYAVFLPSDSSQGGRDPRGLGGLGERA
jgi:hypothetical protein